MGPGRRKRVSRVYPTATLGQRGRDPFQEQLMIYELTIKQTDIMINSLRVDEPSKFLV